MKDSLGHGSNAQDGDMHDRLTQRIQRFVLNAHADVGERNAWMGSGQGARYPAVAAHQRGVAHLGPKDLR